MAPQLYVTMYKEQFASPGRVKREQLRPTSAHRKNNPQPKPDFLFPRSLKHSYRPLPQSMDRGCPLFPPVKHLSFHSSVMTCPDNHINRDATDKPNHNALLHPSLLQPLPSADRLQKLQLAESPAGPALRLHTGMKNPTRMDYQRSIHPLSAQKLRQNAAAHLKTRPQTSNPLAAHHRFLQTQYQSGCCSCFHVVKPYQAGDYIIHPEFVSEGLR